ncbi:MAG: ParB/RepB/Spo0J family partition protein [Parvularculaceae bacterium]
MGAVKTKNEAAADQKTGPKAGQKQGSRSGLGRGLGALMGDAPRQRPEPSPPAKSGGADPLGPTTKLPIAFISPNPDQPRRSFSDDAIAELAASIAARGVLQPILVRPRGPDAYEIVAGERRWRAAQKAKIHEVPVIIRELTDVEAAEIALIENVQRVDLNPVEEAQAYQRLADQYGRTQETIARAVGKSRSHVANMMRLLGLPPKTLTALKAGDLTMGHARALLAAPQPDDLCVVVVKGGLSVRETERLAQYAATGKAKGTAKAKPGAPGAAAADETKPSGGLAAGLASVKKDADTRALEADLAAALGLEVSIDHTKKGAGVVSLAYLSLDQLDDVCRRLMAAGV